MARRVLTDQALALRAKPASGLDATRFDPSRKIRRTFEPFSTVPRDGSVFHFACTARFNPFRNEFEALFHTENGTKWMSVEGFGERATRWCREMPLPYEVPARNWFGYTLTYTFRPKTRRERFRDWLLAKFPTLKFLMEMQAVIFRRAAQGIEARRAETVQLGSVEDESPVAASDAPKGKPA